MTPNDSAHEVPTQAGPEVPAAPERSRSRKFSVHRRHLFGLLFLVGAIVFAPSLRSAYLLDDYLHASMIAGAYPAPRGPFDLYNFVSDADRATLLDRGMLPWWSDPRLTIRFFRPLSSGLVWAEHRALGPLAGKRVGRLLMHLHSFAWWAALVLAANALFRRLLARRPARIATAVFALAPCHALPLAWLANREVLISLAFGFSAIGVYLRWRGALGSAGGRLRDAALAALLFSIAMLGGEYAICLAGYVFAFELVTARESFTTGGDPEYPPSLPAPAWRRVAAVLPFAVPTAAYLLLRRSLGCGTLGSGFYTDPIREPRAFLSYAPRRIASLLLDAWFSLDHGTLMPETAWWILALAALAGAALLLVPIGRVLSRLDEPQRRVAEWLVPGCVLALVPVLAVVPSPRLLGASMLGVAAIVAWLLDQVWFSEVVGHGGGRPPTPPGPAGHGGPAGRGEQLTGAAALVLGFAHLVHGPATAWLVGRHFQQDAASFADHAADLRARIDDPASAEVVVVRGLGGSFFMPFALDPRGAPPARWRILAQTGHALALRRDERTLDIIVPPTQSIFPTGAGNLYRNASTKVEVGDVYTVPGLRATILEMGPEGPRAVRIELDRPIDAAPYVWISEKSNGGFPDAPPPQEGFGKPFNP